MAQLVVRNLDEDIKERLRLRAKRSGRSLEAEVRLILQRASYEYAVGLDDGDMDREQSSDDSELGLGSEIAALFRGNGFTGRDITRIEELRRACFEPAVRDQLSTEAQKRLSARAAAHGRGLEDEVKSLLEALGASPEHQSEEPRRLGTEIVQLFQDEPFLPGEIEERRGPFSHPADFDS